ncbi:metal-dependent hydrolase [Indiicoccus explosivorum]|uniref:metal-dependent hydrolase n=1 Tax=Indiicoccus explosivorum TaxID=1917864 RepID=UPI000B43D1B1|nr:metal-dependent hydrolase [Indiicoccus explosivorum]
MKVSFHGHSVVKIKTEKHTILIDPFITGNGQTDLKVNEEKPDVILLTHGHGDHVGDTVQLAADNDALVVATVELAEYLGNKGVNTQGMNIGGKCDFEFGTVKLTHAFHSSSFTDDEMGIVYTGMPTGILFTAEGKTIYHAGDTGVFGDMKMIGERHKIDVAFLPIGDYFTMGPEDAAFAAELLGAEKIVPIHYNTFPPIEQNPEHFKELVKGAETVILKAGETIEL